ncbi:uncharacterized protein EI90DRAFT_3046861 [Cantharellus anzutake]|uniref:uncharacterized protein n=1 Tax=Cantharellus anzutake TaxID=1750568 RepID=UPI00190525D7|nr:uncharacterized protein EI90DRAFT_3086246 [Cantharellus anzutake]XP_038918763.1 uncharacterized protein EI90DRAFT_3046861 [Cantharellus anzutake]KAF8316458.1 hypothetical protein EI90DRAFT_3086246 [Cantharellus anzutake]KAF8335710.1 hypothetical protein EI90DRAFT_3046861 [Cantharellus anzutake]
MIAFLRHTGTALRTPPCERIHFSSRRSLPRHLIEGLSILQSIIGWFGASLIHVCQHASSSKRIEEKTKEIDLDDWRVRWVIAFGSVSLDGARFCKTREFGRARSQAPASVPAFHFTSARRSSNSRLLKVELISDSYLSRIACLHHHAPHFPPCT